MSEQTRKTRKPKPEPLMVGDDITYTLSGTIVRTGHILLKDGEWCLVDLFDCELDENGNTRTVWICLRPGS